MQSVSVAMASYNGEKYIKEQLESILKQLKDTDEVIISLDPSTDATEQVIASLKDKRIQVIPGPGKGLRRTLRMRLYIVKTTLSSYPTRMIFG